MCIHINEKEKCLVDGKTGEILRPACWDYLNQYHSYLKGKGEDKAAKQLLKDVFSGQRVISKMIEQAQACGISAHY